MPTTRKNTMPKLNKNKNKNDSEVAAADEDDESVDTLSEAAVSLGSSYRPEDVGSEDDEEDKEAAGTPGQTHLLKLPSFPPLLDGQDPKVPPETTKTKRSPRKKPSASHDEELTVSDAYVPDLGRNVTVPLQQH
jgi:hypothetical protein